MPENATHLLPDKRFKCSLGITSFPSWSFLGKSVNSMQILSESRTCSGWSLNKLRPQPVEESNCLQTLSEKSQLQPRGLEKVRAQPGMQNWVSGARCLTLGPDVDNDGQNKRNTLNDPLSIGRYA